MKKSLLVGRGQEIETLKALLSEPTPHSAGLKIQSIEGPGGIGKSTVFNATLEDVDLDAQGYLAMRIDGADVNATSLAQLLRRLIDSASHRSIADKPPGYYFSASRDAILAADEIRADAIGELGKRGVSASDLEACGRCYDRLVNLGRTASEVFPKIREFVDFDKLAKKGEQAATDIDALKEESLYFWEKLGLTSGGTLRNSLKENTPQALSRSLMRDLNDIILGENDNWFRTAHAKQKDLKRLLVVIDDYEALQPILQDFLVSNFLKLLKTAGFASTVIILGRDRLTLTDPSWDQHFSAQMLDRMGIEQLKRSEMDQLLSQLGVGEQTEKDRAWGDTQGYPYLVRLWVDEFMGGGRSAVILKQFHVRITRWMSAQQRNWLDAILFLDEVNPSTLGAMLDHREDADDANDWFQNEASIRDTRARKFVAIEYIRTRLLDYLKLSDPARYKALLARSREFEVIDGEPVSVRATAV